MMHLPCSRGRPCSLLVPKSCDTFVVMGDKTKNGVIIFGKNSDRPQNEVQEVIYQEGADHENEKLKCTYITIDQVPHTYAVILSKPTWMWGAEMGANEFGVCIGNEAVWTKLDIDSTERLLGMDLVRLGLERGKTARESLEIICSLMETHGQGGPCSNTNQHLVYHNSFMIVDASEAWILETAGKFWVAQKITSGFRNISNCLTIGSQIDLMSAGLKESLKTMNFWDGEGDFNFSKALSQKDDDRHRLSCGSDLLTSFSKEGKFILSNMFDILRDTESSICRDITDGFPTMGSMVSVIAPRSSDRPNCHWFTGTPNPEVSVFKPFIFTPNPKLSPYIRCDADTSKKGLPHVLYRRHTAALTASKDDTLVETLRSLEAKCVQETENFLQNFKAESLHEVDDLFKDCVESELKFYIN